MKNHKFILPVALGLFVLGAGCSFTQTIQVEEKNTNASNQNVNTVTRVEYAGQDGQDALTLLLADHRADVSAQGFVMAIDGVEPGDQQFWAFYVNGKSAAVGAKEYIAKSGDRIEWRLENY